MNEEEEEDDGFPTFDEVVPIQIMEIMAANYDGEINIVDKPGYVSNRHLEARLHYFEWKTGFEWMFLAKWA